MSSVDNEKLIYTYSEKSGHFMCTQCRFRTSSFVDICTHFIKNHTVGNLQGRFQCPSCSCFMLERNRNHTCITSCRAKGQKQESLHVNSPNVSSVSQNEDQQFGKQMTKNDIVMSTSGKTLVVKPFHCDICKRDFELKRLLMNHMKAVHLRDQDSLMSCGLCSAEFLQQLSLDVHRSAAHHVTGDDLDKAVVRKRLYLHHLKCHTCSFYTFDRLRLERHSSICNPRGGICPKCKMGFSRRRDLSLHMKYVHSEMPSIHSKYNSMKHVEKSRKRTCSKKENRENLKKSGATSQPVEAYKTVKERFKKIDTEISDIIQLGGSFSFFDIVKLTNCALSILYLVDKGTFRCCLCFTEYASPVGVRSHFRVKHLKLFQCHECSFVCRDSLVFKRHCGSQHSTYSYSYYNKNITFVCDVCGVVFNTENKLARHMISKHDKHLILSRPTRFRCDKCDLNFPNRYERIKHKTVVHRIKAKEAYYCAKCGKKFSAKSSLTSHERQIHCPEGDKLQCTICDYRTSRKHIYEQHMRAHAGEAHACPDCGMRFTMKYSMERHRLTHSREQKYSCPVCGQRFSQGCSMKRHLLTHEKFKPFQCGVCGALYSQLYPLKKHLKKMHPEVDLEDNIVRLSKALRAGEHE